ncbi:non-ribosomal peptide synthetase [Embleya scabrispora]|uniref:non-ribosomal peptide synthetase n=1 Tax=Embleya scabrispora TaxID=159449 RepID=UPI00037ADEC9|nr:non-ribosomal peptide synthetase [Embleya scabrispora]MYS79147.1 amino acid adenylation domain-containing protein [Streptomyces sp. SID5474]
MAFEPIQSLVARAIDRFPDRVAVQTAHGSLRYRELDQRVDAVAAELYRCGARGASVVAVLAGDRAELTAALLAVLRLGGVVVPLDVGTRPDRLGWMLREADPDLLVVGADDGDLAEDVRDTCDRATLVDLGTVKDRPGNDYPPHVPAPDDPCYLFFTSGSTGRPKGILGRLSAVDHYIRWEAELLGAGPQWRVGQLISPAFDAVLRDLLLPLSVGATVCVPAEDVRLDPVALCRWLDRERIDLIHCVPSVFRALAGAIDTVRPGFEALKCVALSGERVLPADAAGWFDRFGERIRLLNLYGPSETTMTKTFHFVTAADARGRSVPIGRPMPDTVVLLLDERGREVPPGRVGEIHLRTAYRSLGYHRRPQETERAFIADPTRPGDDEVVYRTGDFARLLLDGTLDFLGRRDRQVKVGGVRVELDGVEQLLREDPSVAEAAVVSVEPDDAPPYLCAFVETGTGTDPEELRSRLSEHLRAHLPDGAIPGVIVPLEFIPRTISGKIDRKALTVPVRSPARPDADAVAPRTATERTIAGIWARTLPAPVDDVHTRFFDVGTSLAVISVLARLTEEFGVSVPLADFLANQTIEGLSHLVERLLLADDDADDDLFGS